MGLKGTPICKHDACVTKRSVFFLNDEKVHGWHHILYNKLLHGLNEPGCGGEGGGGREAPHPPGKFAVSKRYSISGRWKALTADKIQHFSRAP